MEYKINREDKIMEKPYETNVRTDKKSGTRYVIGVSLAALLVLGFAMPVQAGVQEDIVGRAMGAAGRADREARYETGVTLATIRVPVKLHHLSSKFYSVKCAAYDRPHGALRLRGDGAPTFAEVPSSGEVNTTVSVTINPLKSVSDSTSPLVTWQCHLWLAGKGYGSRLATVAKSGAPFKANVGGSF